MAHDISAGKMFMWRLISIIMNNRVHHVPELEYEAKVSYETVHQMQLLWLSKWKGHVSILENLTLTQCINLKMHNIIT